MNSVDPIWIILGAVFIGVPLGIALLVYLIVPACKGGAWVVGHIGKFVFGEIGDALRLIGGLLTTLVLAPLTVGNVLIGRWSGAGHYGRALQSEGKAMGAAVYRMLIGHPARLLCLTALTEGIEKRIPQVVAAAPGSDRPGRRVGQFEGYNIVGSLPGGGSGGKLYIADPTPEKMAAFSRMGAADVGQVVIKCFSLRDGSSLPQIVRENRALPAAKRLGLILEHDLTDERFYYVMKYVPGESLGLVTQRLHAASGTNGLGQGHLREAVEYVADLARTLCHYHSGGLWHKDVKPDNIIVADGQAHLVDFGLITPLRSSMTLTTHGTEYFRDPEMVRMALRGVKVHEVDGAKFDIYAAGAVLYSVIENSFPAHGGLSQISKRCPEALRWIVRRAMTDYDKRYPTAAAMLADLEAIANASDPFAVKPAMLPSFQASDAESMGMVGLPHAGHAWEAAAPPPMPVSPVMGSPIGYAAAAAAAAVVGGRPRLRVTSWWTGKYDVTGQQPAPAAMGAMRGSPAPRAGGRRVAGATAAEQLARARERAKSARARAHARMQRHQHQSFKPVNAGVGFAVLLFLTVVGGLVFLMSNSPMRRGMQVTQQLGDGTTRTIRLSTDGLHITHRETPEFDEVPEPTTNSLGLPVTIDPSIREMDFTDRGQLMVLRGEISMTQGARAAVDGQLAELRRRGFVLRGEHQMDPESGGQAEEELIAELRSELGLTMFETPDAHQAIERWLSKYEKINAVVWISRGDDGGPAVWLVGRDGVSESVMDAATKVFCDVGGVVAK